MLTDYPKNVLSQLLVNRSAGLDERRAKCRRERTPIASQLLTGQQMLSSILDIPGHTLEVVSRTICGHAVLPLRKFVFFVT